MTGEVEKEEGVLVIRRIHVVYDLDAPAESRDAAERAHRLHHTSCPVYRTLAGCIRITTELQYREG